MDKAKMKATYIALQRMESSNFDINKYLPLDVYFKNHPKEAIEYRKKYKEKNRK